jgi:hypothetical protein
MPNLPTPIRYLTQLDYNLIIQAAQVAQVIQRNQNTLLQMERVAIEEASGYISQRYDVGAEFTNTAPWDPAKEYNPGDRVTIDYDNWIAGASYNQYDCIIYNGIGYIAATSVPFASPELTPDIDSSWVALGYQYSFYNAVYPAPEFNVNKNYAIGDLVYWKGYIYTCTSATVPFNTSNIQQYFVYSNVPNLNTFPDGANNAQGQYWGNKTAYIVHAYETSPGTIVTDDLYWQVGDNRCHQMVMYLCDIAIYHLHRTIAPNNIPELRKEEYKAACKWLEEVAKGYVMINFPQLQPTQGTIRAYGGNIKQNNRY